MVGVVEVAGERVDVDEFGGEVGVGAEAGEEEAGVELLGGGDGAAGGEAAEEGGVVVVVVGRRESGRGARGEDC